LFPSRVRVNICWLVWSDGDGDDGGDVFFCRATADGTRRSRPVRRRRARFPHVAPTPPCPCACSCPPDDGDGDDDADRGNVSATRPTAGAGSPTPVCSTGSVRRGSRTRTSPAKPPC